MEEKYLFLFAVRILKGKNLFSIIYKKLKKINFERTLNEMISN
jgi:hypothetical protein